MDPKPGQIVWDGTLGSGGHAEAILDRIGSSGTLIGSDQDDEALQRAEGRLGDRPNVILVKANFSKIDEILKAVKVKEIHGALLDLGVSSDQLEISERGFSFLKEGPLDMRMDQEQRETAASLVNALSEKELVDLFFKYGEEPKARVIARKIVERRKENEFQTTSDLAELVKSCYPSVFSRTHPATKVFQALRIAVNSELECLESGLKKIYRCLSLGGRVAVISFHSLEDRIVKHSFREAESAGKLKVLTRKIILPGPEEIEINPRARSAKLRVGERTD